MKISTMLLTVIFAAALGAVLTADAFGQAQMNTTITDKAERLPQKATTATSISAQRAQLDLETRVAVLERQVATLRSQMEHLIAQSNEPGIRYIGPDRRVRAPGEGQEAGSDDKGPRLRPLDKSDKD
jgi:hypothetical protein